jgi:T-complex protein 1 subunit zeta
MPAHTSPFSREVSSGFFYSNAAEREKLVASERKFTDEKVSHSLTRERASCD